MTDRRNGTEGGRAAIGAAVEALPGVALALAITVPAWLLGQWLPVVGGPVFAILIGRVLGRLVPGRERLAPGLGFTSKRLLQTAVILLGFGLKLQTVAAVGLRSLPIIVVTIAVALLLAWLLARLFAIPRRIATLVGVGSAICGGSAIAATAPVIDADDAELAQAISVVFLFNVLAALIFPSLGGLLGFSDEGFALFAGTAVNDTSSVTAAASAWDSLHGTGGAVLDGAIIVKLTRTLAILPITVGLAFYEARRRRRAAGDDAAGEAQSRPKLSRIFPTFIIFFVLCSLLTSLGAVLVERGVLGGTAASGLEAFFALMRTLSRFLIVMAMAAIGLNTDLVRLVRSGARPLALGACCWIAIATTSVLLQRALGLF